MCYYAIRTSEHTFHLFHNLRKHLHATQFERSPSVSLPSVQRDPSPTTPPSGKRKSEAVQRKYLFNSMVRWGRNRQPLCQLVSLFNIQRLSTVIVSFSLRWHLGWGPALLFQFHLLAVQKLLYYIILHSYYVVVVYYSITFSSKLFQLFIYLHFQPKIFDTFWFSWY